MVSCCCSFMEVLGLASFQEKVWTASSSAAPAAGEMASAHGTMPLCCLPLRTPLEEGLVLGRRKKAVKILCHLASHKQTK